MCSCGGQFSLPAESLNELGTKDRYCVESSGEAGFLVCAYKGLCGQHFMAYLSHSVIANEPKQDPEGVTL